MPQKILHIITSMKRGGAETLLAGNLDALSKQYHNMLVTLEEGNHFKKEMEESGTQHICLGVNGKKDYPKAIAKLRRLIRQHQPAIVHGHLFIPTLLARLSCPKNIPLLFSIHSILSADTLCKPKLRLLEKLTYRSRHELLAVSNTVLTDYEKHIGIKGARHVLHNYINDSFFQAPKAKPSLSGGLKMVAVGNISPPKNYGYLLSVFECLRKHSVTLDIYGEGAQRPILEKQAQDKGLSINFKGSQTNLHQLLPQYDLYIMPSLHEGFGMAPLEAMACGLPTLLSDIPALREISEGNALFFDPNEPKQLADLIIQILEGKHNLTKLSQKGITQAQKIGKKEVHTKHLLQIYEQAINCRT